MNESLGVDRRVFHGVSRRGGSLAPLNLLRFF
jgi:hypothetical protein